jgi:apolipoprotein N-acyltransferase
MIFSWYARLLLALASGVALALSFPNYNLSLLAWVAIALLVLASSGAEPAVSPLYGFLHGLVFYPICLPWIDVVMRQYGDVSALDSAAILGLIALFGGLLTSLFSLGFALASRKSLALGCALAPPLWVTLEFARAHLPIVSFPWNLTGYAASGNLALVQLTAVTAIWGLSFLIAAYNALLAYAILSARQRAWKAVLVFTAVLIVIALGCPRFVPRAIPTHVAHLVQTNFPQSEEYPADWMLIHAGELAQLENISVSAAQREPGLIVWPEVPAPFSLHDPNFANLATRIAQRSGAYFLVGIVDWKLQPPPSQASQPQALQPQGAQWQASNSAVLLAPSGKRIFTYDKIHLVPFGEYVPLRSWLTFAGKLTADIGDFTPGTEYRVGATPDGTFGAFICYEGIFPNEVRQFTLRGAQLLINMSNDGWFGRSSAPAQHAMMERVRAVENRRWLLRDTNNGFTFSVDPYGRVVAEMPTDTRSQLDAPYAFRSGLTLYARFGDWLPWLSLIVCVVILGAAIAMRRESSPPTRT